MSRYITCDEIREMIDADSLAYLSLEALRIKRTGMPIALVYPRSRVV